MLTYLTRGNSSLEGKSKVCILHKISDKHHFEDIVNDIFDTQNCSIWHSDGQKIENYEIEEMQLAVVIVSEDLLSSNEALEIKEYVDIFFDRNIPVLPIVVDNGLEKMFEELFGNIEYLDKVLMDTSAIPYTEKLELYLNNILVSTSLRDAIKKSFDAGIFLSYRKKDRVYAQKLMKIIHSFQEFESVAIWYDEFLVPGEDYDNAIEQTIKSSDVFALVMTPNILESGNYVEAIEYPFAVENKMKILPVEMTQTDHIRVEKQFIGVPELIWYENHNELKDRLAGILHNFSLDFDAEKKYYLGEAYLSGVFVEVDREKAYALIRSAGEDDFIPAMSKLVSMFEKGEAVKKNISKAIEWQKKIVEIVGDIAEKTREEEDALTFLQQNDKLVELLHADGKYDEMYYWSRKSYDLSKKLCFGSLENKKIKKVFNIIKKYTKVSEHFEDSYYYFLRYSRILLEYMLEMSAPPESKQEWSFKAAAISKSVSIIHFDNLKITTEFCKLCSVFMEDCINTGNSAGLEIWEENFYNYIENIPEDGLSKNLWYWVTFVNMVAGECYYSLKEFEAANNLFEAAENNINILVAEYPKNRNLNLVKARICIDIARKYFDDNDNSAMLNYLESATKIINVFDLDENTVEVALAYYNFAILAAKINIKNEEYNKCIDFLYDILESTTEIFSNNLNAKLHFTRAKICVLLGGSLISIKDLDRARKYYLDANIIVQDLCAISKSPQYVNFLAEISEKLLQVAILCDNYFDINQWYEKAYFHRYTLSLGFESINYGIKKKFDSDENKMLFEQFSNKEKEICCICSKLKSIWLKGSMKRTFDDAIYASDCHEFNESVLNNNFKVILDTYLDHHPMIGIYDDLCYLMHSVSDNCEHNGVTSARVAKSIIRFFEHTYNRQYTNPYAKYEENAMIIYAYELCNYCWSSHIISKQDVSELLEEKFYEITFWYQKFSEIEHKDVWFQLYQWQKIIVMLSNNR